MRTSGFGILFIVLCSSILFMPRAFSQAVESDMDRPGMDYRNFDLASPDPNLCESACREDAQNCKVWTYVKPGIQGPKARCWLKSGIPSAVKNSCCISGMIQLVPPAVAERAAPEIRQRPAPAQIAVKLDPGLIQKLQAFPSRDMMISSLMANQATRSTLESFAGNAKMNVAELSKKSLDGKMATVGAVYPVGPVAPKGKKIDELNWTGGIKFSLIKNVPKFFDPSNSTEKLLGNLFVDGTWLASYNAPSFPSASESFSADTFYLPGDHLPEDQNAWEVVLDLFLPPAPSAYIIAVQGGSAKIAVQDKNNVYKKLDAVNSSTIGGTVGMTLITPELVSNALGKCSIHITSAHNGEPLLFSGITITRL